MSKKERILELPIESEVQNLQRNLYDTEDQLLEMGAEPGKDYTLTDLIDLVKGNNLTQQIKNLDTSISFLNRRLDTLCDYINPEGTQWI